MFSNIQFWQGGPEPGAFYDFGAACDGKPIRHTMYVFYLENIRNCRSFFACHSNGTKLPYIISPVIYLQVEFVTKLK